VSVRYVEALLTREDLDLRAKTLFRMLYETAARASEVLALDVDDLDRRNRCAKVNRKGGAVDVIVWQTATARSCPACSATAQPDLCSSPTAAPASSYRPATSTRPPAGPDCPTAGQPNCSSRPPAGPPCTNSATAP
jgi:hypothetical protein